MNEELQCIGCGVMIQTEYPDELGYTPKAKTRKRVSNRRCLLSTLFPFETL